MIKLDWLQVFGLLSMALFFVGGIWFLDRKDNGN